MMRAIVRTTAAKVPATTLAVSQNAATRAHRDDAAAIRLLPYSQPDVAAFGSLSLSSAAVRALLRALPAPLLLEEELLLELELPSIESQNFSNSSCCFGVSFLPPATHCPQTDPAGSAQRPPPELSTSRQRDHVLGQRHLERDDLVADAAAVDIADALAAHARAVAGLRARLDLHAPRGIGFPRMCLRRSALAGIRAARGASPARTHNELGDAVQRGHLDGAAKDGLAQRERHVDQDVHAITLENLARQHLQARTGAAAGAQP